MPWFKSRPKHERNLAVDRGWFFNGYSGLLHHLQASRDLAAKWQCQKSKFQIYKTIWTLQIQVGYSGISHAEFPYSPNRQMNEIVCHYYLISGRLYLSVINGLIEKRFIVYNYVSNKKEKHDIGWTFGLVTGMEQSGNIIMLSYYTVIYDPSRRYCFTWFRATAPSTEERNSYFTNGTMWRILTAICLLGMTLGAQVSFWFTEMSVITNMLPLFSV